MTITRFPSRAAGVTDRVAGFVAHLRMNGMKLGPGETADALAVLRHIKATDSAEARLALRSLLVPDAEAWRQDRSAGQPPDKGHGGQTIGPIL